MNKSNRISKNSSSQSSKMFVYVFTEKPSLSNFQEKWFEICDNLLSWELNILYCCTYVAVFIKYKCILFIHNFNTFRINILQVFFYKKKKVICKLAQDFVTLVKLSSKIDQDRYAVIIIFFCVPKYSKILWKLYSLKRKEC